VSGLQITAPLKCSVVLPHVRSLGVINKSLIKGHDTCHICSGHTILYGRIKTRELSISILYSLTNYMREMLQ